MGGEKGVVLELGGQRRDGRLTGRRERGDGGDGIVARVSPASRWEGEGVCQGRWAAGRELGRGAARGERRDVGGWITTVGGGVVGGPGEEGEVLVEHDQRAVARQAGSRFPEAGVDGSQGARMVSKRSLRGMWRRVGGGGISNGDICPAAGDLVERMPSGPVWSRRGKGVRRVCPDIDHRGRHMCMVRAPWPGGVMDVVLHDLACSGRCRVWMC